MRTRVAIGAVGVLAGAYGLFTLLQRGLGNLWATAVWLAGGIVLHDFVLAPLTLALAAVVVALVPRSVRGIVTAALVVLGTVTLSAVPVLGRFGARPDNPTLLDRNYLVGWLLLVAVVCVCAGAAVLRRHPVSRRTGRRSGPSSR